MAQFSVREVGLFVLVLAVALGAVLAIHSGVFAGPRAGWAWLMLGLILVVDLARANIPWIRYDKVADKYATNPVIDVLREQPHLWRLSAPPQLFQLPEQPAQYLQFFRQIYQIYWLQYNFPYYNIQAIEPSQMPREIDYYLPFNRALAAQPARLWQLTNTRYLLSLAGLAQAFNAQFDPQHQRFRVHTPFELMPSASGLYTAAVNTNGPLALIEFAGALPRARLFSKWQVNTNDQATLQQLAAPEFDPLQTVLVAEPIPAPQAGNPATEPGDLEIISYSPRRIECRTSASNATVLLFNERHDPDWEVTVDGRPATLLRCNYVMRGVQLPAGTHTVVFRYQPSLISFLITFGSVLLGLSLCGYLLAFRWKGLPTSR